MLNTSRPQQLHLNIPDRSAFLNRRGKQYPATVNPQYSSWQTVAKANKSAIVLIQWMDRLETYNAAGYPHASLLKQWGIASYIRTRGRGKDAIEMVVVQDLGDVIQSITQVHHYDVIVLDHLGEEIARHQGWRHVPYKNKKGEACKPQWVRNTTCIWTGGDIGVFIAVCALDEDDSPSPLVKRTLIAGSDEQAQAIYEHYKNRETAVISIRKPDVPLLPARVSSSCVDPLIGKTVRVPGWAHRAVVESYDARGWYALRSGYGLLNRKASEFTEVQ